MKKILITTALIASLGLATTPVKADTDDFIKVIGAVIILDQLFNKNDHRHNGGYHPQNGGYYPGGIYDDRGYDHNRRVCNGNLGCTPYDNNPWNNPRKHGYARGYDTGEICGQRTEHYRNYTETLHLDCNGNVLFVTRHAK